MAGDTPATVVEQDGQIYVAVVAQQGPAGAGGGGGTITLPTAADSFYVELVPVDFAAFAGDVLAYDPSSVIDSAGFDGASTTGAASVTAGGLTIERSGVYQIVMLATATSVSPWQASIQVNDVFVSGAGGLANNDGSTQIRLAVTWPLSATDVVTVSAGSASGDGLSLVAADVTLRPLLYAEVA